MKTIELPDWVNCQILPPVILYHSFSVHIHFHLPLRFHRIRYPVLHPFHDIPQPREMYSEAIFELHDDFSFAQAD